ncbi:MAG: AAA family ATPase [Synergistes sp.]|nr:AAA family ATPase [Synergistes sp.]
MDKDNCGGVIAKAIESGDYNVISLDDSGDKVGKNEPVVIIKNAQKMENSNTTDVRVFGINFLSDDDFAEYNSFFKTKANKILRENNRKELDIRITTNTTDALRKDKTADGNETHSDEKSIRERARNYRAIEPEHTFEQLILPQETKTEITNAADLAEVQDLVFGTWGLKKIEPHPRTALNFYGPSGTGKTLAAHALAHRLKRKILSASYADIESKFVGDGPKNVQAIFEAARRDNALLFIDEADSLLSKRLTNVTSGSESALNSMRSQLLICLEQFEGIVIFATNLVENYDHAFETRIRYVEFKLPDKECLRGIWLTHLVDSLPLAENRESIAERLSEISGVCGRDIKNAVIDAAVVTALKCKKNENEQRCITYDALKASIETIKERNSKQAELQKKTSGRPLSEEEKKSYEERIKKSLSDKEKCPSPDDVGIHESDTNQPDHTE